tara:strand:+ start:9770 stop:12313 length:2544 start_codon:yes stop_codon:yes gene_type:complete
MRVIALPDGEELTFPDGTSDTEIYNAYYSKILGKEPINFGSPLEEEKKQAGFFGALREGITSLGDVPEAIGYLVDPSKESREELLAGTDPKYKYQDFYGIPGLFSPETFQFGKEILGGSLGQSVAPLTAGAAVAAVSGPFAPVTGLAAFIGTAGLQYLGETAERQARLSQQAVEEGKEAIDPNVAKVVSASFGAGALDRATLALFPNVSKLFGQSGKKAAKDTSEEIIDIAKKDGTQAAVARLADSPSVPLGAIRGAGIEAFQEVVQTMLSRAGAEDSLFSQDAVKEYIPAFVGGAILGMPVGALDTAATKAASVSDAQTELQDLLEEKGISQRQKNEANINADVYSINEVDSNDPETFKNTFNNITGPIVRVGNIKSSKQGEVKNQEFSVASDFTDPNITVANIPRNKLRAIYDTLRSEFIATKSRLTDKRILDDDVVNQRESEKIKNLIPDLKTFAREILTNTKEVKKEKGEGEGEVDEKYVYKDEFTDSKIVEQPNGKFIVADKNGTNLIKDSVENTPMEFDTKIKANDAQIKGGSKEVLENFKNAREVIDKELEREFKAKQEAEKEKAEQIEKEKKEAEAETKTSSDNVATATENEKKDAEKAAAEGAAAEGAAVEDVAAEKFVNEALENIKEDGEVKVQKFSNKQFDTDLKAQVKQNKFDEGKFREAVNKKLNNQGYLITDKKKLSTIKSDADRVRKKTENRQKRNTEAKKTVRGPIEGDMAELANSFGTDTDIGRGVSNIQNLFKQFVEDMESTLDQVGKIGDDIKDVRDLVEGNVAPEGVKVTDEIILQKITNITQEIKNKQNEITKSEIDEATNNNINNENKKNAVKDVTDNVMKNDGC